MQVIFESFESKPISVDPRHVVCVEPADECAKVILHLVTGQQRGVQGQFRDVIDILNENRCDPQG